MPKRGGLRMFQRPVAGRSGGPYVLPKDISIQRILKMIAPLSATEPHLHRDRRRSRQFRGFMRIPELQGLWRVHRQPLSRSRLSVVDGQQCVSRTEQLGAQQHRARDFAGLSPGTASMPGHRQPPLLSLLQSWVLPRGVA